MTVVQLHHPGQCCGNCRLMLRFAPGRDGYFTGECDARSKPNGERSGVYVVDNAGTHCLWWQPARRRP